MHGTIYHTGNGRRGGEERRRGGDKVRRRGGEEERRTRGEIGWNKVDDAGNSVEFSVLK